MVWLAMPSRLGRLVEKSYTGSPSVRGLAVGVFHIAGAIEGTVGVKRNGYAQIEPAALLVVFGAVKHKVQPKSSSYSTSGAQ